MSVLHGSGAWLNTRLDSLCERVMISMEQLNAILHAQSASTEAMVTRLFEGMASRYAANVPVEGGGEGDGVIRTQW